MTEVDFYYYPEENVIRDSDGDIIYDIFRFVDSKPSTVS